VVDLQALGHTRTKIVKHHIGLAHQVIKNRSPSVRLEVNAHAFLAAVEGHEICAHAIPRVIRVLGQ
jgi:hypothetical protein